MLPLPLLRSVMRIAVDPAERQSRRPLSRRKMSALQGATAAQKNSKRDIEGDP
jgi:hypothetical protein